MAKDKKGRTIGDNLYNSWKSVAMAKGMLLLMKERVGRPVSRDEYIEVIELLENALHD